MAGQTRLPTFSMKRKSSSSSAQPSSAVCDHVGLEMADRAGRDLADRRPAPRQAAGVVVGGQVADQRRHADSARREPRQRLLQQASSCRRPDSRPGSRRRRRHRESAGAARAPRTSFCLRMFWRTSTRRGSWLIARSPWRPAPAPGPAPPVASGCRTRGSRTTGRCRAGAEPDSGDRRRRPALPR